MSFVQRHIKCSMLSAHRVYKHDASCAEPSEDFDPAAPAPVILHTANGEPYAVLCAGAHALTLVSRRGSVELAVVDALECLQCKGGPVCEKHGPLGPSWVQCSKCFHEKVRATLHEDFAKARKVTPEEYEGHLVTDGENYGSEAYAIADPVELEDGTRFVWGTRPTDPPKPKLEDELENWLQEEHEDAADHVDYAKLGQAETLVHEALSGIRTYWEDRTVAIVLPREEAEPADSAARIEVNQ